MLRADYIKEWRKRNPDKERIYWERGKIKRRILHLKTLDCSPELYDEVHIKQNGLCAICGKPETSTYRGQLRRLAVDHCHISGKFRGLLCANCNTGIGKLDDNPDLLRAAIDYLEKKGK